MAISENKFIGNANKYSQIFSIKTSARVTNGFHIIKNNWQPYSTAQSLYKTANKRGIRFQTTYIYNSVRNCICAFVEINIAILLYR